MQTRYSNEKCIGKRLDKSRPKRLRTCHNEAKTRCFYCDLPLCNNCTNKKQRHLGRCLKNPRRSIFSNVPETMYSRTYGGRKRK